MNERELLRIEAASKYVDTPVPTLRWLRQQGRGPKAFVMSGRLRYLRSDLDAYVAEAYSAAVGDDRPVSA